MEHNSLSQTLTMAQNGLQQIESRKRADAAYKLMDQVRAENMKVSQIANFEINTAKKIETNCRKEAVESRKSEYEKDLFKRRTQLADLYNSEMQGWRKEVYSQVESQEDRKQRIMERAYALRDAREEARQKIVHSKLNQQWRDACDDARTLDSQAMTKYMNEERLRQIEAKKQRKQQLSEKENDFLDEWNRQLDEIAARDKAKQDLKYKVDMETAAEVKAQIAREHQMREDQFWKTRHEELDELAKIRSEIEAEEESLRKKKYDEREQGRVVREFNESYQRIKDSESSIEKDQDKILLDYALRKEAEQKAAEEAAKQAGKDAAKQYQKYLQALMVKEAEDTAFVDEINRKAEEAVWKARDDALQAREDARNYLMKMVDEGRQEQIRSKKTSLEKEMKEGEIFASKFLEDARSAVMLEKREEEMRKQKNIENQKLLTDQIEYRKYKEDLEKQEVYLADKRMKYIERQHMAKLQTQAGTVRSFFPMKKSNL